MELLLERDTYTSDTTLGKLRVYRGRTLAYICETLEDARRGPGIKVPHETCIPPGRYRIALTESRRFGRIMPMIYNHSNGYTLKNEGISFDGTRMHGGTDHTHTSGCIITAYNRLNDRSVQGSAERDITEMLKLAEGESWIEIK